MDTYIQFKIQYVYMCNDATQAYTLYFYENLYIYAYVYIPIPLTVSILLYLYLYVSKFM